MYKELHNYLKSHYPQENEKCEWKEFKALKHSVSGREGEDIISYVSAISNMKGGHLVVGVEDNTLKIVGIRSFHTYDTGNIKLKILNDCPNLSSEGFNIEEFNVGVFVLTLLFFASVSFLYDVFILAYKKDVHPQTSTGKQWVEKKYIQAISTGIRISVVRALSALVVSFFVYTVFSVVVNVIATYIFISLAFFLIVIKVYYFFENYKKANFVVEFGAGILPSPYILPIALFFILSGHFWSAIVFSFLGSIILEVIVVKNALKAKKPKKKAPIVDNIAKNFPKLNQYFLYFLLAYCILYLVYVLYSGSETLFLEISDFLQNPLKHQ